jgi:hypothetical protein
MNHMTQPTPDAFRLVALIDAHDKANSNTPDSSGKIAGFDSFALTGAAGHRAQLMIEGHGTLRKTLTPQQIDELTRLLAAMWRDGFAVGVSSQSHDD